MLSCHQVIPCHPVLLSYVSLVACEFVTLSICYLLSFKLLASLFNWGLRPPQIMISTLIIYCFHCFVFLIDPNKPPPKMKEASEEGDIDAKKSKGKGKDKTLLRHCPNPQSHTQVRARGRSRERRRRRRKTLAWRREMRTRRRRRRTRSGKLRRMEWFRTVMKKTRHAIADCPLWN